MESSSLSRLLLFFLLLLFSIPHSHPLNSEIQAKCHERERDALLEFKATIYYGYGKCALDDHGVSLKTWTGEGEYGDCCDWAGIECDKRSGYVTSLVLQSSCLFGSIDSNISIFKLSQLRTLDLSYNNFGGVTDLNIFFQLESLEHLDLSYNKLTFIIDSSIKNRSKLSFLNLASCNLISFPLQLQSLDHLKYLDLSFNDISEEIPTWLCNLDSLSYLFLSNNSLTGMIPKCLISVNGARSLISLDLSQNYLSGFEGNLPSLKWRLEHLDLRFNELKGSLPMPSTNSSLTYYLASNNELSGELPTSLCNLVNLKVFDLGGNNLSGVIPQCLANLVGIGNLFVLNMHNNDFSGPIPKIGKNRCNLVMIDMSYNQLEGPVPREMENCTNLGFLNLGSNRIIGAFPFWLGKIPTLSVLTLSSNRFHGILEKPSGVYEFPKLQILELSHNNINGHLSVQFFESLRAMKVDVEKEYQRLSYASNGSYFYTITITSKGMNLEYKKIPKSLIGVDLSNNHFTGEIPKSIATLKGIHFLNLSNNMFTGYIPFNLNGLTNLESLDLSHNKLIGEIPE